MRVKELIKALQKLPQSYEVLVDGYEGGLGPAKHPITLRVACDVNVESYYGPHEEITAGYNDMRFTDEKQKNVVVLHR